MRRATTLAACVFICACRPHSPEQRAAPPPARAAAVSEACSEAARAQARAEGLFDDGRLDRTVRLLHHAAALCPGHGEGRALLSEAEAALHAGSEPGEALVAGGLEALAQGRAAEAQRLLDRGRLRLEARFGEPMRMEVANGYGPMSALPWRPNGLFLQRGLQSLGPALALSSDGRMLALNDGPQIVILDRRFEERMRLVGHESEVHAVAFHSSGRFVVSGSQDRSLRGWDLDSGRMVMQVGLDEPVREVVWLEGEREIAALAGSSASAFSFPDGARTAELRVPATEPQDVSPQGLVVLAEPDNEVRAFDLKSGRAIAELAGARALARSRRGDLVALQRRGSLELWAMPALERRARLPLPAGTEPELKIYADRLLAAGRRGGLVRLWQLPSGAPLPDLRIADGGWIMGLRRDGMLALREGTLVRYVDPASGAEIERLDFSAERALPWATALDGDALVTMGPFNNHAFTFWNTAGGERVTVGGFHTLRVGGVALAAERGKIAVLSPVRALLIDAAAGRVAALEVPATTRGVELTRGGEQLAAFGNEGLWRWDLRGKRPRALPPLRDAPVLAVSADGHTAVRRADDGLELWDLRAERALARVAARPRSHVTLSRDGGRLAWIEDDGRFVARSPEGLLFSGGKAATALALSADGRTLAVADEGAVSLWDVVERRRLGEALALAMHAPVALAVHGRRVLSLASGADDALRLWQLDFGRRAVTPIESHLDLQLTHTLASSGGVLSLASGAQHSVALHDLATGRAEAVLRITHEREVYALGRAGWLETFGKGAAAWARCRVGHLSLPLAVCAERRHERGRVLRLLRGEKREPAP